MLTVNDKLPRFQVKAVIDESLDFPTIHSDTYAGKWLVLFSWPKDFTFVCPTELTEFGRLEAEFSKNNTQLLGFSTDSEFVHHAWRTSHPKLKTLNYPMLSDIKRELSEALGILDKQEGVCQRATFIVDPEGSIRFAMVTDLNVGRNPEEVLRVLKALQTGELCPCSWQPGEATL